MRLYLFTVEGFSLVGRSAYTELSESATLADAQRFARDAGVDAYMVTTDTGETLTAVCAVNVDKRDAAFAAAANVIWK